MAATVGTVPLASSSSASNAAPETPQSPETPATQRVRLQSGNKEIFIVDVKVAKLSKVIKQMIDDLTDCKDIDDFSTLDPIPLDNVSGPILRKIVTWMEYHEKTDAHVAEPAPDSDDLTHFTDEISDWDEEFVKVDQGTLFELILATNYLNVKKLRTICCKTVANALKKKSVEQIREQYNIENDFTGEEEEVIKKENEWCEDQDAPKA